MADDLLRDENGVVIPQQYEQNGQFGILTTTGSLYNGPINASLKRDRQGIVIPSQAYNEATGQFDVMTGSWVIAPGQPLVISREGSDESHTLQQQQIDGETTDLFTISRDGNFYTIFQIEAPSGDGQEQREATLTLMRKMDPDTGGPEFVDLYNMNYEDSAQYGIRVQSRGTGELRDFVFDFFDGNGLAEAMRIKPNKDIEYQGSHKFISAVDQIIEFADGSGNRRGYLGSIVSIPGSEKIQFLNQTGENSFELFDDGRVIFYSAKDDINFITDGPGKQVLVNGVPAETTTGAQEKADNAEEAAITYTDSVKDGKIYGVFWAKVDNPVLTRTNDAKGLTAAVGTGSALVWNDFDDEEIYRDIKKVTDTLGNVFVRIPKFYIKKKDAAGYKSLQISKTKHPGFYLPWCFWDFTNGVELPHFDIGAHRASLSADNKLESKPGVAPLASRNIVQFRDYARANNVGGLAGYQQMDMHAVDVLRALFTVEFATLNSQSVMNGRVSDSVAGGSITGFSANVAASSGSPVSNTSGLDPCVYRGIESPWGDMWCFIDGANINNHQAWVAKNADDYASNVFAAPYEQVGYINATANGYAKFMGFDPAFPFVEFPVDTTGASTTYYSDYYYQATGQRVLILGGNWTNGADAGLWFWIAYSSSASASSSLGGRLLKKAL